MPSVSLGILPQGRRREEKRREKRGKEEEERKEEEEKEGRRKRKEGGGGRKRRGGGKEAITATYLRLPRRSNLFRRITVLAYASPYYWTFLLFTWHLVRLSVLSVAAGTTFCVGRASTAGTCAIRYSAGCWHPTDIPVVFGRLLRVAFAFTSPATWPPLSRCYAHHLLPASPHSPAQRLRHDRGCLPYRRSVSLAACCSSTRRRLCLRCVCTAGLLSTGQSWRRCRCRQHVCFPLSPFASRSRGLRHVLAAASPAAGWRLAWTCHLRHAIPVPRFELTFPLGTRHHFGAHERRDHRRIPATHT